MAQPKSNTPCLDEESIPWIVYKLRYEAKGPVLYIGKTGNQRNRIHDHRRRFGPTVTMETVETGIGKSACNSCERLWIAYYRSIGEAPYNILSGGCSAWVVPAETRIKFGLPHKGVPKSPEQRAKMSAAQKGKPKHTSPEGRARLLAASKKGLLALQQYWKTIPPEERSRLAIERSKAVWAKKTSEERLALTTKMFTARMAKSTPEQRSEIARNAKRITPGNQKWWDSVGPEVRLLYASRMKASLDKAKVLWTPDFIADIQARRRQAYARTNAEKYAHLNGPDARLCKRGHKNWAEQGARKLPACLTCIKDSRAAKKAAREANKAIESSR